MPGAFSDWSAGDSALLAGALSGIYADMQTTKDALKRGGVETNPIYGTPHPSGESLDQESLASAGLVTLGAGLADKKWRRILLAGITGLEGALAYQNAHNPGKGIATPALTGGLSALLAGLTNDDKDSQVTPYAAPGQYGISYTRKF